MINNFKKPNLNAPRYREKRLGLLNKKTISEFKEKKPLYSSIDDSKFKKIVKLYNNNLWNCLLYTSPSPRDQRGSRMPSSA